MCSLVLALTFRKAFQAFVRCRFDAVGLGTGTRTTEDARLRTVALIVAAGRGARAASSGAGAGRTCPEVQLPKQYLQLGGETVIARTATAFLDHPAIEAVAIVIHADDRALYDAAFQASHCKLLPPVIGGPTRQDSVRLGLEAVSTANTFDRVLIHDAARPFVSADVIARVIAALDSSPGAIAALPLTDTLKEEAPGGNIARTLPRAHLWRAQTPQGFHLPVILDLHRRALAQGEAGMTDDAALAEWAGIAVALTPGSDLNLKLTTAEDIDMAQARLGNQVQFETRTGTGFDVHRFTAGDRVWLGGVEIAHTHALEGHSDADVALHALTDALLGTIGDGDIGQHFPPSDEKWRGAASILFLEDAAQRIRSRGGRIVNVDITILAEAPKIGPHRVAMQAVIGKALGLSVDRVGVKATTTEGLGFTGRREGIAAMASATVSLPVK